MKKLPVVLVLLVLGLSTGPLGAAERLTLRVTPSVAFAPAYVRVEARVATHAANRTLRIVAESDDFYRASEISLDGEHAPPISVFNFRALPTGLYEVTGILVSADGSQTVTRRAVQIAPGPGE